MKASLTNWKHFFLAQMTIVTLFKTKQSWTQTKTTNIQVPKKKISIRSSSIKFK